MILNGKEILLKNLSLLQLNRLDDAMEVLFFKESHLFLKGEPFAASYKKDPKQFQKLLSCMVSFKRALMGYFQAQYDNRYNLIRQALFQAAEEMPAADVVLDDTFIVPDDSEILYPQQWDQEDEKLAAIIEQNTKDAFDLGITTLILLSFVAITTTSDDKMSTDYLLKNAKNVATTVNDVTKKRILAQVKASVALNENRAQFEARLKKVLVNPYRGRFIAQDQALRSYLEGKDTAATDAKLTKKTWNGVQTDQSEICGGVIGDTVGIDENFSNGLDGPLAHLGCKCDLTYS